MKTLLGKRLANSVSSVGSMVLFLLFAVCSLIMISVGAVTYSRISDSFNGSFNSSAAVRYVTNKIRSGERVVIENDGAGLAVYSGEMVCVIMTDDGSVGERNAKAEAYREYVAGDIIFPGTTVKIIEEDGFYVITAKSGDNVCMGFCRGKEG
ncbi:MAG: hypothetical protein IK990_06895 [Ruminiclostridium sp.]|nr:hypothetical protein [Ruminiclostridium sp.]